MVLDHESAVSDTVEEGLGPIPRGVESDGPPERAGTPEAEAEDHSAQSGGEQSDGRFARVAAVAEAEQDGQDCGRGPEAQGWAVTGLEGPLIEAGEAARERVLDVAAGEVLLLQADQEEAEQPDGAVAENVAAKEQAAVDDEESGFHEGED